MKNEEFAAAVRLKNILSEELRIKNEELRRVDERMQIICCRGC